MKTRILEKIKVRKFRDSRQLRSIYFTFKLVPKHEPIDVNATNLVITNFGSLTFKILQSGFIALSCSFFFVCSCMSIIILSIVFILLCRILLSYFLEWSHLTFDFVHIGLSVVSCNCVTIFISPLFYFLKLTLQFSSISTCPSHFKSLMSSKRSSINSCFMNLFSLLLDKIVYRRGYSV